MVASAACLDAADFTARALSEARELPYRSPLLHLDQVLAPPLFEGLCARWPAADAFEAASDPSAVSGRSYLSIVDPRGHRNDGFPAALALSIRDIFQSGVVCDAIDARLGCGALRVCSITLLQDLPSFTIPPHTDGPGRVVSLQLYVSCATPQGAGTRFHDGPDEAQDASHAIPFVPNTGYLFRRTEDSWHSCRFEGPGYRNSVIVRYRQP